MTLHFRIALLLLGSGLSALLYQTAWQRSFRLVFGATTGASAAVLAVFMGGLGLGGYFLGKIAEKKERPLAFYANLELGVSLIALVSPFTTDWLGRLYLLSGGEPALGFWGATALRLLIACLVMGPAAWLMGGTLPAAARAAETDEDRSRRHVAVLYGLNTAGAVVGSVIGTFALFELVGTRLTLWFGCMVNLLVAVVARAWARGLPAVHVASEAETASTRAEARSERLERYAVYAAALVVGLAFIGSELVWFRMLSPLLGGSTYSFGLILALALAGIGLGGFLYSLRRAETPVTWSLLALTVLCEAFFLSLPLWLGDGLALFTAQLRNLAALGYGTLIFTWVLVAGVAVFPPALVAGYQFPVLIALLGRGRTRVAAHVGQAYLWNTAGSVLGSLLVGFWLVPRFGAVATWRGLTLALLAAAALAVFWAARRRELVLWRALGLAAALGLPTLAFIGAVGPTAVWRHTPIGAGRVSIRSSDANQLKDWFHRRRNTVLWERDGVDITVAVTVDQSANFVVSGKSDGSVHNDRGTQAMSALLGAILHPEPKQAFVLGLGTGMSAGWLARAIEHVDVAELEPAILDVARVVGAANAHVLEAENVDIFLGDGREFLLTTDKKYDLLVSEPSNPYRAGVAALFTTDFYRVIRSRMAERAIFVQWLQGYEVNASVVLMTLKSLREVFPFVEIWQAQETDIVFLSSLEPRSYDIAAIRERVSQAPYLDVMRRAWLAEGAEALFSHGIGNARLVDALLERNSPSPNTDDENVLEFSMARTLGRLESSAAFDLFNLALGDRADEFETTNGTLDMRLVRALRYRNFIISGNRFPTEMGAINNRRGAAFEAGCTGPGAPPLPPGVQLPAPGDLPETYAFARILALQGNPQALELAQRLSAQGFATEADVIRGLASARAGDHQSAADAYERAMEGLRSTAMPLCESPAHLMQAVARSGASSPALGDRLARALLRGPFIGYNVESLRKGVAQDLAFRAPDPELCVQALERDLEEPKWTESFLRSRAECLERAGHPAAGAAVEDVATYLANTSGSYGMLPPARPPVPQTPEREAGRSAPEPTQDASDAVPHEEPHGPPASE